MGFHVYLEILIFLVYINFLVNFQIFFYLVSKFSPDPYLNKGFCLKLVLIVFLNADKLSIDRCLNFLFRIKTEVNIK